MIEIEQNKDLTFPPVKYTNSELEIRKAIADYQDLHIIPDDNNNYVVVMKALGVMRKFRISIEKDRKEIGSKILSFKKQWDDDAKRLTAIIEPEETRLQTERLIEDKRKEDIRLADERKEQERIAKIKNDIQVIRNRVPKEPKDSIFLQRLLSDVENEFSALAINKYQEFFTDASIAYTWLIENINSQLSVRLQWEKEETDRKAEIEFLATLKKEREEEERRIAVEKVKAEVEQKAKAEIEKAIIEKEKARAEAERIAREGESQKILAETMQKIREKEQALHEERKKLEIEKRIEEEKKAKIIWEAQAKAEREEFEKKIKIQVEYEARKKADKEEKEKQAKLKAEEEEKTRQDALKPDREKIMAWIEMIGVIPDPDIKDKTLWNLVFECRLSIKESLTKLIKKIG